MDIGSTETAASIGGEQHSCRRRHCCISHEFLRAASRFPEKIAVVHASSSSCGSVDSESKSTRRRDEESRVSLPIHEGDQSFTFSDVLKAVDSLSRRLRLFLDGNHVIDEQGTCHLSMSLEPLEHIAEQSAKYSTYKPRIVGIYMPPSVEYIISLLSVLRCGEAFLPLDPSWPRVRILSVISSSKASLVVSCRTSFCKSGFDDSNKSDSFEDSVSCPVIWFSIEASIESQPGPSHLTWPCQKEEERLFCYLMYTSGSTGMPKGVCGTEQGLLNRFLWMQDTYPLHEGEEVLLFKTPISFIDHLQELLSAMLTSCTLIIPPSHELKSHPSSLINFLQAYSVNRMTVVPSLLRAILPALRLSCKIRIENALKLLVLSGEVFPISLWTVLSTLLPRTIILNLYGSTEVSGDCTHFDCKSLPSILETNKLTSVPIGHPISNCDVVLVGGMVDAPNEGEICVGGTCLAPGYFSGSTFVPFDYVNLNEASLLCESSSGEFDAHYYKTGDFAHKLQCGELVFVGRKDRTMKVNGQRVALEEVENTLREHSEILDAAVIPRRVLGKVLLDAFLILKGGFQPGDFFANSFRNWMAAKVPLAMIPNQFVCVDSFPVSATGKIDHVLLGDSVNLQTHIQDSTDSRLFTDLLQNIKLAFRDALMVEHVSADDDFFSMGGDSISAAHVSYNLGMNMNLLYSFPTPSRICGALLYGHVPSKTYVTNDTLVSSATSNHLHPNKSQFFKVDLNKSLSSDYGSFINTCSQFPSIPMPCSFSKSNKVMHQEAHRLHGSLQDYWSAEVLTFRNGSLKELWKAHMESCVDASPVVVFMGKDVYLFIGSHANQFTCFDATSGFVKWKVRLGGRIECSAAVVGDFSQVVIGCYGGQIYFLDFLTGSICWTFKTNGEVKCQPIVDIRRELIWCGSHDHTLYALSYKKHCCVFELSCDGSIFSSPVIDEANDVLLVATTSGRVIALSLKGYPFSVLWKQELKVPIFGSLAISLDGKIVICLVDGSIVVFDIFGLVIWKHRVDGPVFAGACISHVLPNQVLICSRSGSVYCLKMQNGDLLWEYNIGDAITASAYVDEHLHLMQNASLESSERLVCVCGSSGNVWVLCASPDVVQKLGRDNSVRVREFARLGLPGGIFSSPVMIRGRIFLGCRDDFLHCLLLENHVHEK